MNCRNIFNLPIPVQSALASLFRHWVVIPLSVAFTLSPGAAARQRPLLLDEPLTLSWSYSSSVISSVAPAREGEGLYLPLVSGEIVSLRVNDGQLLWRTDVGGDVLVTPTSDAENLYVASEVQIPARRPAGAAAYLRSISRSSGVILWFSPLPRKVQNICAVRSSSILAVSLGDIVIGVDKMTGAVRWSSQLATRVAGQPLFSKGLIYLPVEGGELVILNMSDGKPVRRYRTRGQAVALSLEDDGVIYWATAEGEVNASTEAEGTLASLWRKRVSAEVQSLNRTQDGLLIVSRDNSVTYLKRQNGKRLWKRHLPDRLAVQPVVYEGYGLFAPLGDNNCVVLSLRDGRQVNTIQLGADNFVVATPVIVGDHVLIPTKLGLLSFTAAG